MRVAVLIKQVPKGEATLTDAGTLRRDGVELEVNAYCRRANAKAVELAGDDGEVVVFTMGPPSADDALREMIACGATRGVLICDPALAGSDTLVTARVLGAALHLEGPFDLVLAGLNAIDADTGQVPPQVAELLDVPFVHAARQLGVTPGGRGIHVVTETDTFNETVEVALPALVSTAERLCEPSKAPPEARATVAAERITRLSAAELGFRATNIGLRGSPTQVGPPRLVTTDRRRAVVDSVDAAVAALHANGAFDAGGERALDPVPIGPLGPVPIWVVLDRPGTGYELLGRAADLAVALGGTVTAIVAEPPAGELGRYGADDVVIVAGSHADDRGELLAAAAALTNPAVILVDGTFSGRAIASKIAARHGWGLIGDGISVDVAPGGRLTVWKPALGGRLVAPITSTSPVQMATIRPGALPPRAARQAVAKQFAWSGARRHGRRVQVTDTIEVDTGRAALAAADVVIGVGQGVDPERYALLEPLAARLGAVIGATRKVTDRGWMPRSRQIGITGSAISPRLYISVGASGRYNHSCGFAAATTVLAVNADPDAEIFDHADVGIVGDWAAVVAELAASVPQVGAGTLAAHG
ncbi:MAG TPA: FAD-binding protein [Ilumatobacter sp.]|nr:FAD-binding protein [Ilumatobacter sp.]